MPNTMTLEPSSSTTKNKNRAAPPTILVIFGASGDLTGRKLLPAIFNLGVDELLPEEFHLIGFGRKQIEDEEFKKSAADSIAEHSRRGLKKETWEKISKTTCYHQGGYDEGEAYIRLAERVDAIEKEAGTKLQLLFYISTPPSVFEAIIENLGRSGLASRYKKTSLASKVVIEKPFGRDLESARELNRLIGRHFHESQVFRIDHYLGKETVQDLLVQRFANSIFEPIWNQKYIDYVEITVAEELGVGSRGGYYDHSGACRDMIQNHMMQLLSLVAMEPPISSDAEQIRDEKVKLLRAIQPLDLNPESGDAVRAQYTEGIIGGEKVKGYLCEENIESSSFTETYVALRLLINNWRWQGVPFYVRSGKRMSKRISEIAIHFKQPPSNLFRSTEKSGLCSNTLIIQIQPDEGTALCLNSKAPGLETKIQPIQMSFRYATAFGSDTPEAYERLILDSILGDSTLFIRSDETEVSWNLYTPLLESWQEAGKPGLSHYIAGTWGPKEADELLSRRGHKWRTPGM